MVRTVECLLLLTIFSSNICRYCQKSIFAVIPGNLRSNWQFTFAIAVKEFNGVVLHCIDKYGDQMGISVNLGEYQRNNIRLTYNTKSVVRSIKGLCDCSSCDHSTVNFSIHAINRVFKVTCNGRNTETLSNGHRSNTTGVALVGNVIKYPMPKVLDRDLDSMYVMIGNIGPYEAIDLSQVIPYKEQLTGCLSAFFHDNKRVNFSGGDTKMRPSCHLICKDIRCNGGACIDRVHDAFCDCAFTARNGRYCNNTLKKFQADKSHTYTKVSEATRQFLKMTWKQLLYNDSCLLEIVNEHTNYNTIYLRDSKLLLNDLVMGEVYPDGVNFVSVDMSDNYFTIKGKNISMRIKFSVGVSMRVNVGLSERTNQCEIFDGAYDFFSMPSMILMVLSTTKVSSLQHTSPSTPVTTVVTYHDNMVIVVPIVVSILILNVVTMACILYNKIKRSTHAEPTISSHQIEIHNIDNVVAQSDVPRDSNVDMVSADPNYYSLLEYSKMYRTHLDLDDGYMVLKPQLPPRDQYEIP